MDNYIVQSYTDKPTIDGAFIIRELERHSENVEQMYEELLWKMSQKLGISKDELEDIIEDLEI